MKVQLPSPIAVRDFAKSIGWTQVDSARASRLYVMNGPGATRRQITLAMDDSAPDYWEAVRDAIAKLADIREMSFEQAVDAVDAVRSDVVHCTISPEQTRGSLPLAFAQSAVHALEQLLLASACGVLKPRIHHPRLQFSEAKKLVDSALLGQTERGSYVFKVALPLGHERLTADAEQIPFVRRTTLLAQKSLALLIDAIEGDQLDELIDGQKKASEPILSSNICDAAALLLDDSLRNSVAVDFRWGFGAARPEARGPVKIQYSYLERIEEVASEFQADEGDKDDTFVGTVEAMAGSMGNDKRRSGDVILELLVPELGSVKARVNLGPTEYAQADFAHMNDGHYVKVKGRLRPGRQPRRLIDVASFELIRPM